MSRIRELASDTLIYGVFTIVGRFLTFLLTPLYTNYLSIVEFGDIGYIFAILAFMNIIYGFGMDSAYFRFFDPDKKEKSRNVFTHSYITIAAVSLITSSACIVFSGNIAPLITELPNGRELIILAALIPFLDALMIIPYSRLRITRKAKRFALTKFFLVVIAVGLNFLFVVHMKLGAVGVLYAQVIANAVGASIFLPTIVRRIKFKIDFTLLMQMLRFGLPTMPAMISGMILQVGDRWILKPLTDSTQFAIYQCNYKLGIPMMLFVSVFEYAWKPFYLTRYKDADAKKLFSRVLTYFTLMAAGIFLITGMYMDFLVRVPFVGGKFINPEYWGGMGIIPLILGAYYFNGVFNNVACGFHIEKKTEYLPIAVGIAAGVNVAINFILIPEIGYWGAAWATLAAYFTSAAILYVFARKVYRIRYEWKRLLTIIILAAAVYSSSMEFSGGMSLTNSFIIRTAGIALFVVCLGAFGFFTKDEIRGIKGLFKRRNKFEK